MSEENKFLVLNDPLEVDRLLNFNSINQSAKICRRSQEFFSKIEEPMLIIYRHEIAHCIWFY